MPSPYVTGAAILDAVENTAPSQAETDWADLVAGAVDGAIVERLGATVPSAELEARLALSALQDGMAAYVSRDSPHGVLSIGPDGAPVRLGSDLLRATGRVLLPGIG